MVTLSGFSVGRSTLSSVYLSGVTCGIITCSYGRYVRCICLQFYPVVCVTVWCNLWLNDVFLWTLCQVYLPSGVTCRACISLVWPVTYVCVHMDSVSGVSAIRSTLWIVYLSGVTFYISMCSYGPCVRCICHQLYSVECVSLWCDLWHNHVFIWILCQVYLPWVLLSLVCICLVWPLTYVRVHMIHVSGVSSISSTLSLVMLLLFPAMRIMILSALLR
jgi:hypothetical protein